MTQHSRTHLDEGRKAASAAGDLQQLHAGAGVRAAAHVVVQWHQRLPLHRILLAQEPCSDISSAQKTKDHIHVSRMKVQAKLQHAVHLLAQKQRLCGALIDVRRLLRHPAVRLQQAQKAMSLQQYVRL